MRKGFTAACEWPDLFVRSEERNLTDWRRRSTPGSPCNPSRSIIGQGRRIATTFPIVRSVPSLDGGGLEKVGRFCRLSRGDGRRRSLAGCGHPCHLCQICSERQRSPAGADRCRCPHPCQPPHLARVPATAARRQTSCRVRRQKNAANLSPKVRPRGFRPRLRGDRAVEISGACRSARTPRNAATSGRCRSPQKTPPEGRGRNWTRGNSNCACRPAGSRRGRPCA